MSDTGLTVPGIVELPRRYDVIDRSDPYNVSHISSIIVSKDVWSEIPTSVHERVTSCPVPIL